MARHSKPQHPTARRALFALVTAGAALGAGAATAHADTDAPLVQVPWRPTSLGNIDPEAGLTVLTGTVGYVTGPVAGLKPNPLAGTGVDPLDNGVGTQVADFKPVGSQMLTAPIAEAQSLGSLPVVGQVLAGLSH
ncbi:hypothetical protein OG586_23680 [Streptomyces murinus]|uniref:hypothetical protein n=1 Tax=Streptomyces murinus TaxID=33900 RepID=UPI002E8038FA|nr:hypothetical protein [Streptomyces murinus]WUD09017.1 hypothetical protein OG586_23680 [Streptomyces murinus]